MTSTYKDQFRNDSGGFISVVTIDARNNANAVAVRPGDTVWLSEEEQILTANAPRNEADNPLTNGSLTLTLEGKEIKNARPLRPTAETPEPEPTEGDVEEETGETGAPPAPVGEPEEGQRAPTEEVATPEAVVAADGRTVVEKDSPAPSPARRRAPVKA